MRLPAIICFILMLFAQAPLSAQAQTGTITGKVTDASGAPLGYVMVQIGGTKIGTQSGNDGRFEIRGVPIGTHTLIARMLGYLPKQLPNLVLQADSTLAVTIKMEPAVTELQAERITASADRGTVAVALEQQRSAPAIVNTITAEQITKSPDSDAAQAVQRVSGVTVQDGKYVFVRGLGERYTTTSLNGARIPSPEPEKREVPLDLFPSNMIQGIVTSKTFTPDQPGDFGGASVDIQTREFPRKRMLTYSSSFGYNSVTTGKNLSIGPRSGIEWLGFGGSARNQPTILDGAAQSGDQTVVNRAIRSLRNVWEPTNQRLTPNYSFSASMGGQAEPFGRRFGYLLSGTYNNSQDAKSNEHRAIAVSQDGTGTNLRSFNAFAGRTITSSVLWGGIFNTSTLLNDRTRLVLNNTYNRSADNEATQMVGTRNSDDDLPTQRSSLRFIERSVRSNQLRIEHMFTEGHALTLAVTSSGVSRKEPDRTEVDYVQQTDPATGQVYPYALAVDFMDGARKTFGDLKESNLNTTLNYNRGMFKFGTAFRYTNRDAVNNAYSLMSQGVPIPRDLLEQSPHEIFSGSATEDATSYFGIRRNTVGGSYTATDAVSAAYAMVTYPIGERFQIIGGARVENANMRVRSQSNTGGKNVSTLKNTDLLPSINAQYSLTNNQKIRFGFSQTLSRPEYREISPITQIDLTTYQEMFGNANLVRSTIQNYDTRWEWYPNPNEIISIGFFAKHFDAPIERVDVATSGRSQVSFINADNGYNYGVELELRKQLDAIAEVLSPFTFFTNTTLMKSEIDMSSNNLSAFTNKKRPMLGQAPYVVNAGLNYASGRVTGSVLYNVVGKRIRAGGGAPLPDVYDMPRNVLDMSFQFPVMARVSAKIDARNLLNAPYEIRQGSVIRSQYEAGRVFSAGFKWQP